MRTIEEVVDEIEDIEIDDINVGRATAVAERLDEILEIHKAEQEPCEELDFVQPHKKMSVNLEVCDDVCEWFEQYVDIVTDIVELRFSDGTVKRAKRGLYMRDVEESIRKMLIDQMANEKKQEPCTDAISRQAAFESIKNLYPDMPIVDIFNAKRKWLEKYAPYFECENAIEQLPSVTSQPKMGRWIIKDSKEQGYDIAGTKTWYIQIMCDKCGFIKTAIEGHMGQYKFCPNCGQPKMQEVEE